MSALFNARASILVLAFGIAGFGVPAQARIVIEPRVTPAALTLAPGTRVPAGLLPSLILMPLACDTARSDPLLRARIDRLVQRQQLDHTLARAHFWRSQR